MVDLRLAVDEVPQEFRETRALLHDLQIGLGAVDRALDLGAVAHDAGIVHQRVDLLRIVARDLLGLEIVEGLSEIVALAQDRDPRQAGLETVEDQLFVQRAVVIFRHAPFGVVIGDVERIFARPRAARLAVGMQARGELAAHATVCFGGVRTSFGSVRRIASPPDDSFSAGVERVGDAIGPDQRDAVAAGGRTHGADRLVAGENGDAGFRREIFQRDPHGAGARGAAMLHPRHHFLADIAALVEIDAVQAVHVGLVRKRIAVHEVEPAARHAVHDAMRLIGGFVDQIGADQIGHLLLQFFGNENAPAERLVARIGERKVGLHGGLAVPHRQHAEAVGEVFDRDLGAQLVETELVGEALRQRARRIDQEPAAMAARAPP